MNNENDAAAIEGAGPSKSDALACIAHLRLPSPIAARAGNRLF
jgi:hypothetical protein